MKPAASASQTLNVNSTRERVKLDVTIGANRISPPPESETNPTMP
jgi:hypothetical protein